jgi:hypothetical protein
MHQSSGVIQLLHRLAAATGFALVVAPAGHAEQLIADNLRLKTGDTPALLLEQDTTESFPAQTWILDGNEFSFEITDATAGPTPFSISAGAPPNSLVVSSNGSLGVGTDAPESTLHINGDVDSDVFSGVGPDPAGDSGQSAFNFGYSGFSFKRGSGFFNMRPDPGAVAPNPSVRFMTRNFQRMIIDRDGNVGIGQFGAVVGSPGSSPSAKLHVQGSVLVEGNVQVVNNGSFIDNGVTLNVPDYVFEPDYKLMPLNDLQAYIDKERHLPEIPSAQEIKEQGVKLGEMQMQLLKKIEELTLYTLQQERTNQAQQQMIQEQTQVIEKLQAQAELMQTQARMIEELQARLATLERKQGQ